MIPFASAWTFLKQERKQFSAKDVHDLREKMQEEKKTKVYNSNRGQTQIENLMGIHPLRQTYFTRDNDLSRDMRDASTIDREFAEGYKNRMNPPVSKLPTKVIRYSDYDNEVKFQLEDDEGKSYSQVGGKLIEPHRFRYGDNVKNALPTLTSINASTPEELQRRGYYNKLLNTILQNNMNIFSSTRNTNSQPFHENFQQRLPPNVDFTTVYSNPEESVHGQRYLYQSNPIKQEKQKNKLQAMDWGDLQLDYNTAPMINASNNPSIKQFTEELERNKQKTGTQQTRLDDKFFLSQSNPEHPEHDNNFNYFKTNKGEPYSTFNVMIDPYNDDYENHPYFSGLGALFG